MLLTHSVKLDDAADEMLRARRREQARADGAVLRNEVLGLLLMKRPTQLAACHRRQEVHEQEQRAGTRAGWDAPIPREVSPSYARASQQRRSDHDSTPLSGEQAEHRASLSFR